MSRFTESLRNIQVNRPGWILRCIFILFGLVVLDDLPLLIFRNPAGLLHAYHVWLRTLVGTCWILAGISGWSPKIWNSRFAGSSFISLCGLTCAIPIGIVLLWLIRGYLTWTELLLCIPVLVLAAIPPVKGQKGYAILATLIFGLVLGCAQLYLLSRPGSVADALAAFAFAAVFLLYPRIGLHAVRFCLLCLVSLVAAAGIGSALSMRD